VIRLWKSRLEHDTDGMPLVEIGEGGQAVVEKLCGPGFEWHYPGIGGDHQNHL
jgi:hypothetical protein